MNPGINIAILEATIKSLQKQIITLEANIFMMNKSVLVLANIPIQDFDENKDFKKDKVLMAWNDYHLTLGDILDARGVIKKLEKK